MRPLSDVLIVALKISITYIYITPGCSQVRDSVDWPGTELTGSFLQYLRIIFHFR
jgi:hypothetical protein